jgi:spore coat polysaccharide biosynthesis protein SpsF
MNPGIILQARLGSSRFPRKVLHNINGKKVIDIVLNECKKTDLPLVVAYPDDDLELRDYLAPKVTLYSGSENDVIARFYHTAKYFKFDPIIRVTADAKLIKHELILQQLENYKKYKHIVYGNFCEVFSFYDLEHYYYNDKRPQTREHVTLGMIQDMTVDYEVDLI